MRVRGTHIHHSFDADHIDDAWRAEFMNCIANDVTYVDFDFGSLAGHLAADAQG